MAAPDLLAGFIRQAALAQRVDPKLIVVTGGNAGIGFEIVRGLAAMGHHVVLASRDLAKGEAARKAIPQGRVEVMRLDLADLADVRRFAADLLARHPRLDVLVNNAGLHTARFARTKDGFEETFGVNHLGHFALTQALLPALRASRGRVVTVASQAHRGARVDWSDLQLERHWSGLRAYANSKLFNVWFARELARREPLVASHAAHPGSVRSGWARGPESGVFRLGVALASPFLISPEKGARTPIWLASADDITPRTGGFFYRRKALAPSRLAQDDAQASRLWDESEKMLQLVSL